ncbi:PREDICTED: uncharacterized protein LOC107162875 isoform X2 [Diuraphis noxia]|uniref:uncharacterized protein LOC107162875 isoform X2 n=1 Tax=Diuraphis noxia TaxID=143948 RepID=UPI000763B32C|nr:PREDICTED: uncharacterized protein LOC107162875 isoform X2 [Diuraphis noxia]
MTPSHKTSAVVVLLLACVLRGLCQEQKQNGEGFKCPEEFGYYPHPNDCSQYYVCVFGGALLESCTGGLMYSHELQTCDWPRNVGCGAEATATQPDNQENALALARSSDRQRHPSAQPQRATPSIFNQRHQVQDQQVNEQLVKQQQLYEEEDFRAIEDDSDRQQRVYRGQPSTLGQVARDRDGISKHRNIIPQFAGVEKNKQFQIPNQNYRPQQISVPSYVVEQTVQPMTTTKTTTSTSSHNGTQYDPAFYSIYDDDSEIYKDVDYGQFTLSSVNNNNNRLKPQHQPQLQSQPQLQLQSQPQQDTFRVPAPLQQPTQRYQANTYVPEYNLKITEEEAQREQQTKATYRGRVRGGATYTTASSNDIDRGTPAVGRTRPTLKPSTSIVSKASEFVDVYKYAPSRPDPIYPTPQPDKTAAKCRKDVCQLPDCSCGGKEIPGDLAPEETPQIVLLTFDDSVNDLNKGLYTDLFEKGRVNPNGCPISATFYVSHEWTDYSQVQNLYASGHEIASHSVSHSFGEQFSQKKWTKEIVGQREILSAYGGVRQEDIRGMRAPFLAVGGNKMFKMLYDSNFTYDSSMPIYENKPPSWPYTLDYKLFHDCMIPPCPTRSYPGVWEVPMVMWQDLNGGRCSMGDACSNPSDADGVQKMLMKNFDRHFTSNRAPFGLFYHAAWFTQPHHKEGFIKFLDNIVSMPEVWIVTNWQAIQWVRDPTSISRLQSFTPFHCDLSERPKKCNNPKVCNLWHKSGVRYMRTCQPCPDIYPWTGKSGIRSSRIDDGSE